MRYKTLIWLLTTLGTCVALAAPSNVPLDSPKVDLKDFAALQRGARFFVNRCQPCHSLDLMRYESLARGIKITDEEGKILDKIVQQNLMFDKNGSLVDTMHSHIAKQDAESWFGVTPPDLSLVVRSRGRDWVYTFLRSFYKDPARPLGANNLVFKDVGMPNILLDLQGEQIISSDNRLILSKSGKLSAVEFDALINDLVSFMEFVSEPTKVQRQQLGIFVLMFIGILIVFTYLLHREYWKDVES